MQNFLNDVFNGDYAVMLGDYYTWFVGGVGACIAILAFAGVVETFKLLFTAIVNIRR